MRFLFKVLALAWLRGRDSGSCSCFLFVFAFILVFMFIFVLLFVFVFRSLRLFLFAVVFSFGFRKVAFAAFQTINRLYKSFARKPWLNGLPRACTYNWCEALSSGDAFRQSGGPRNIWVPIMVYRYLRWSNRRCQRRGGHFPAQFFAFYSLVCSPFLGDIHKCWNETGFGCILSLSFHARTEMHVNTFNAGSGIVILEFCVILKFRLVCFNIKFIIFRVSRFKFGECFAPLPLLCGGCHKFGRSFGVSHPTRSSCPSIWSRASFWSGKF